MTPGELIDRLGGGTRVAVRLGAEPNTVGNWRKRGIPAWAVPAIRDICKQRGIDPGDALTLAPRRIIKERAA